MIWNPSPLDTQMVAHLLGTAQVGSVTPELSYYPSTQASSHPSCGTAWDVLLHHHRMAKLASGTHKVWSYIGNSLNPYNSECFLIDSGPHSRLLSSIWLVSSPAMMTWGGPRNSHRLAGQRLYIGNLDQAALTRWKSSSNVIILSKCFAQRSSFKWELIAYL